MENAQERRQLAQAYQSGKPYPHCVIENLFDEERLRVVREEIISNIEATYKETDLFKMLQTGDLANMDALDESSRSKLPNLLALRDALYSKEFRSFISDVTDCGELSDKTDCACNIHPVGGHLLCHDDVIGDRRVSFIIYLTDPDEPWGPEDGGALELYPESRDAPHTPDIIPTATVLPIWNTMAMFTVEPGKSFHSIQEVYATEKPRMSIQGWYHAPMPYVESKAFATLQQLQANPGEEDRGNYYGFLEADDLKKNVSEDRTSSGSNDTMTRVVHHNARTSEDLSASDVRYLSEWINPAYLDEAAALKIRSRFEEEGSVQLQNFLNKECAGRIMHAIKSADMADGLGDGRVPSYDAGMSTAWRGIGPAHKQRYLRFESLPFTTDAIATTTTSSRTGANGNVEDDRAGRLLEDLGRKVFGSAPFARLIRRFTTIQMLGHRSAVRRFRPGLDYTVAHFGGLTKDPRMDAVLCFVDDEEEDAKTAWDSGEVGGFEAYLLADEGEDRPAEVYRAAAEDESGVLNVSAASNTLNLVLRDEGLMRFVKYLSAFAPGSRWDVAATMLPEDDSDEEGN